MGVLGHSEDIQAPFIDVLQVLLESRQDDCKCLSESHNFHVVSFGVYFVHHIPSTAVPPGPS